MTVSLASLSSLSVTVKVRVTTWFAAVVPGAVQVVVQVSSSRLTERPHRGNGGPRVRSDIRGRGYEINRSPSKDSLVLCLDADRRVGTGDRDRDTVRGVIIDADVGRCQGEDDHLVRPL